MNWRNKYYKTLKFLIWYERKKLLQNVMTWLQLAERPFRKLWKDQFTIFYYTLLITMAFIMVESTVLNFKQLRVLIQQELHFHARYDRVLHPSAGVMQTQGLTPCWSYTTRILWGWKTVAEILPPASFSQWKSAFCRTSGLIEFSVAWGMLHEPCGPVVWESVGVFLPASYPSMSSMNTRTSSTHQLLDYAGAADSLGSFGAWQHPALGGWSEGVCHLFLDDSSVDDPDLRIQNALEYCGRLQQQVVQVPQEPILLGLGGR